MKHGVYDISLWGLSVMLLWAGAVVLVYIRWSLNAKTILYALSRMLVQLVLVGYVLVFVFEGNSPVIVVAVLSVMLIVASWIALRPIAEKRRDAYSKVSLAVMLGGASTLALVTQAVLRLDPWFEPHYMVPLAGMIFSNAMNSVSLAAERFESEVSRGVSYVEARNASFKTALLPLTNSLLAVGLVSLPGMMTGQILSGVSPLIAARYQIMVMCMIFSGSGISSACYLHLQRKAKGR